ncbi:plasmid mobilization protein, partial [Staphylococcus pseudintermedius]
TIRFSEDDYFKLQVLANKENLTVTQYIRMRSLKRYKNIVIANEALIKKLQEQNDLQEVELQTIKFELIERLATILRRRTS